MSDRPRALVVDDDDAVRRAVGHLLERSCDVVSADGVRTAVEILERDEGLDIILSDMAMHDGSGIDLYEWVCQHRPALQQRMVFMSGGGSTTEARRFLAETAPYRLDKPFRLADLEAVVTKASNGA